jgi:hypothetical protein
MVLKKKALSTCVPNFDILKKITLEDNFPILVTYKLLDELKGVEFFPKLNPNFNYHQIYMKEAYIPKTSFRIHEGHDELLVIPFGLCNAPSTL